MISPENTIGSFEYILVFNKLLSAELCTMNLQLSSILEFDSKKVGYFLRSAVFFKSDNGAALSPQETRCSRCLQKQRTSEICSMSATDGGGGVTEKPRGQITLIIFRV